MREDYFYEKLREIYATFSKAFPAGHISAAIFKRVQNLPDDFMDYALTRLENDVSLPQNLGRYLRMELWWDYLEKHPEQSAYYQPIGCFRCKNQPGIRLYWEPDGTVHPCKCVCNMDPRIAHISAPTDAELLALGYFLENPCPVTSYMPKQMRDAIGHDEPVRKAHAEYMETDF